jgi:hypothetical protein
MSAVFGIDAHEAEGFVDRGVVCVKGGSVSRGGFRCMKTEDIIFIKDFSPETGLSVKAVGVVLSDYASEDEAGVCLPVCWAWRGCKQIEDFDEQRAMCDASFYEEHNITLQKAIIDLLPEPMRLPPEW